MRQRIDAEEQRPEERPASNGRDRRLPPGTRRVLHLDVDAFLASVEEVLHNALQGTETANFELPLYTKKGERVEVLLNAATRRNTAGAVTGVVGVGQDITERKSAETRVSNLAKDLRLLIDSANAPIIGIDAFGCVNEWNNKAAEITGYTLDEVTGRYLVRDFIIDDYKVAVNAVLNKALQGNETDNFEFPFITKGGERVEVLLNATTRRDATGAIVGVVGVGQDITEMKSAQAEQRRVANDLTLLIDTVRAPSLPTSVTRSPLVQPADALHILHARHRRTRPFSGATRMAR